jgi:nucleoid-associated protein YgaU
MKRPILAFTSVAAVAAAALWFTLQNKLPQDMPQQQAESAVEVKKPEPTQQAEQPKPVETPAAQKPAEVAVAPKKPEAPAAVAPIVPKFDTVRVEPTGEALIAGQAEPESEVKVKWNGNVVGSAKANAEGSFVVIPEKPLAKGTGALTLEVNKNGAVAVSEGSVVIEVKENAPAMVAKVDPKTPTQVVQTGETPAETKDVQLTAVDYDAAGNIVFSGRAAAGSVVRFYVDNKAAGEGVADAAGNWSFKGSESVKPGTHMLRADSVDAAGKVVSRIELPFLREAPEAVAAAQVATAEPAAKPAPEVKTAEPVAAVPTVEQPVAQPEPENQVVAVQPQPEAPAPVVEEGPRTLVIQPGNTLWKLSREVYGKGRMYTIIFKANRNQVKNPNRIYPGQILTAPKPHG